MPHVLAVCTAAAIAVLAAPAGAGAERAATAAATATSVTRAAGCPSFGATAASSGKAKLTRTPRVAVLENVQVQSSACVDEVAFLFSAGLPGWSAGYRSGQLVADPSGKPVRVAGSAHLVIRLSPASGVDTASVPVRVSYGGPTVLRPAKPSAVAEVRRLGDFEAVTTWAVGLPARRRYSVVARGNQLVVRIAAPAPRATRCVSEDPALSVGFPASWYTELSNRWPCRYFSPAPFVVYPATDRFDWAVTVDRADSPARRLLQAIRASAATVRSHATRVAGLPATVLDVTTSGLGMYPAGYQYRQYVVDAGARAVTITSAVSRQASALARYRAAADRIAALMRPTTSR